LIQYDFLNPVSSPETGFFWIKLKSKKRQRSRGARRGGKRLKGKG